MRVDLKITTSKSGANATRTISDINPTATNANLLTFSTMLVDLTTNTYVESNKVTTTNIDTESDD